MDGERKLLILEGEQPRESRVGERLERTRALNAISSSGAKVIHDSGGRFIVIETSRDAEEILGERMPGPRLVPVDEVDEDIKESVVDLDPTESLFLDSLRLRNSESYQEAKRQRPGPGETPEERIVLSNPEGCMKGY